MKYAVITVLLAFLASASAAPETGWHYFEGEEAGAPSVSLLESDLTHITVEVRLDGFRLEEVRAGGTAWHRISVPDCFPQHDTGLPELPSVCGLFAHPWGTEASVTVLETETTVFSGINVMPRQAPETDSGPGSDSFIMNADFYHGEESFPEYFAKAEAGGGWSGLNVSRLVLTPFCYTPSSGELEVVETVKLRIDFHGSPEAFAYPVNPSMVPAMERDVINWSDFQPFADLSQESRDDGVEYVFVCTEESADWVYDLFSTHHFLGLHTRVETLSAPATHTEIKSAISDNYQSGTTRFACIVGTHDELPSFSYGSYVGDYYYALMDAGYYPDLAVGRLTGDSAQIVHQVEKIIDGYMDYDFASLDTPGITPSETVLAAHEENYPGKYTQCCNEVAAYSYDHCDITFTKVFPPEGGTRDDLKDAINNEVGTVGYRGHGAYYCWQWQPGWTAGDAYGLTNTYMPPVFNIACSNGMYNYPTVCISESWQWAENGASGNLGASRSSYTIPNHDYMKQIYIALYDSAVYRVCEAIMDATAYTITNHGSLGITNARCYIWFGDPAMDVWTFDTAGMPQQLQISHPATLLPGNQDISVTVTADGSPVQNAAVTVTDGIDNYGNGMTFHQEASTDASGQATVNVTVPSSGIVHFGAYLHDYGYDIAEATVENSVEGGGSFAGTLSLEAPFPNPAAGRTSAAYSIPSAGRIELAVYDVTGRRVETLYKGASVGGSGSVDWEPAESLSSGLYFIRLDTQQGSATKQVMLLR
ncbi:MAG: T9SS type A sorting domain-containing protein [Candidatus Aegiribacteria sp.]|nr:T9SS type A sorting domain-containing protein [Candidatus Aegiribacteria sp.]MBD3294646.1 T9SS type A sorting domain-containing protein [Candidatus Fermentibacteria bacterium]